MVASEVEVPTFQLCRQDRNEIATAIPMFWVVQLSDGIGYDADRPSLKLEIQDGGLLTPNILPATENICLTVEIVLPSYLRTEICVFPVWRPPSWNNWFQFFRAVFLRLPLDSWIPET